MLSTQLFINQFTQQRMGSIHIMYSTVQSWVYWQWSQYTRQDWLHMTFPPQKGNCNSAFLYICMYRNNWAKSLITPATTDHTHIGSKTATLGSDLPDAILEKLERTRRNIGPLHCIYLWGLEDRPWRRQRMLHCPYRKRAHIYQRSIVAINSPCFWSLKPIPDWSDMLTIYSLYPTTSYLK